MSAEQFTNNATTTLGSSLSSGATSATVATGTGSLFPVITGSQFFTATLWASGSTTGVPNEIVKVTARTGDTMTIVRGQEGTTAQAWNVGDTFANYPTALYLSSVATQQDVQLQAGNYAVDSGSANAMVVTLSPVPASLAAVVGMPIRIKKSAAANTGNLTLNLNVLGAQPVLLPNLSQIPVGDAPANGEMVVIWDGTEFVRVSVGANMNQTFGGTTTTGALNSGALSSTTGVFSGNLNAQASLTTPNASGVDVNGTYTFNALQNNDISFLNPATALATFENPFGTALQLYYSGSTALIATMIVGVNATNGELVTFKHQNTANGTITTNGTNVTYGTTSDARLKTGLGPLTGATERLMKLPVYSGKYIGFEDRPEQDMFLAHELQAVVPVAVTGKKDEEIPVGDLFVLAGTILALNIEKPLALPKGVSWVKTGTKEVEKDTVDLGTASYVEDYLLASAVAEPQGDDAKENTQWRFTHNTPKYQNVDHGLLTPLLTAGFKEQKLRADDLEARLEKAEAAIAKLLKGVD